MGRTSATGARAGASSVGDAFEAENICGSSLLLAESETSRQPPQCSVFWGTGVMCSRDGADARSLQRPLLATSRAMWPSAPIHKTVPIACTGTSKDTERSRMMACTDLKRITKRISVCVIFKSYLNITHFVSSAIPFPAEAFRYVDNRSYRQVEGFFLGFTENGT